jgi:hypothetical protein
MGSFLIGDLFTPSYITDCIRIAEGLMPMHKLMVERTGAERNSSPEMIKRLLAQADDNLRWAKQMRAEGYHSIYSQTYVTVWAAQESGIQNVIAAILQTQRAAAEAASQLLRRPSWRMSHWPWSDDANQDAAEALLNKAKGATAEKWKVYPRIVFVFNILGVSLPSELPTGSSYDQAGRIRNIIVHRYGRPNVEDVKLVPSLKPWLGKALLIDGPRLRECYEPVKDVFLAVFKAVNAKGF